MGSPLPQGASSPPFLVARQWSTFLVSHSLLLPGLSVQGQAAKTARKGTPATVTLSLAELRERGEEGPFGGQP